MSNTTKISHAVRRLARQLGEHSSQRLVQVPGKKKFCIVNGPAGGDPRQFQNKVVLAAAEQGYIALVQFPPNPSACMYTSTGKKIGGGE